MPAEDPPPAEGIFEDILGEPEPAVPYSYSGAPAVPMTSPGCVDLCITWPNERSKLFEFACSLNSQLGLTSVQRGINHIGLSKERLDLGDENQCSQLDYQIEEAAKTAPPHLWSSIPCTSGSPIHKPQEGTSCFHETPSAPTSRIEATFQKFP
jgi:hypothetical protein